MNVSLKEGVVKLESKSKEANLFHFKYEWEQCRKNKLFIPMLCLDHYNNHLVEFITEPNSDHVL